jgi:rhodanese-related sulfurtransferase
MKVIKAMKVVLYGCIAIVAAAAALAAGVILLFWFAPSAAAQAGLSVVERLIESGYKGYATGVLRSVSVHEVYNLMRSQTDSHESGSFVVIDVRSPEEYAVSHLPGALLLPPSSSEAEFAKLLADRQCSLRGKRVIWYCSVGVRSSESASALEHYVHRAGAVSCENMKGGIFRWYNEGLPVVNERGSTQELHPFDALWGRLVVKHVVKDNNIR